MYAFLAESTETGAKERERPITNGMGTLATSRPSQNEAVAASSPRCSTLSLSGSRHQITSSMMSLATNNVNYDSLKNLASQVVAYHICQADNNITCMVPEFVYSLAANLTVSPQLVAYKELLLQEPHLQNMLTLRECVQNPSKSFVQAVLEPLSMLKRTGKIHADQCIIIIDSLNEAEFHRPDYGDTVASFLTKHIAKFPPWLKVVTTVRTVLQDLTKFLPFHRISLDKVVVNEHIHRDLLEYIHHRVNTTPEIRNNIATNNKLDLSTQNKFCNHLQTLSRGCFLYCKLLLDLIEQRHLVLKSSNYKILPVNLSEVFLLRFNLKFPSIRSFEKASPILSVCLASLYPLTQSEIFEAINAGYLHDFIHKEEFAKRMEVLAEFLLKRSDGTYMFFHPAFREWLIRRDEGDNTKFLCDLRYVKLLHMYPSKLKIAKKYAGAMIKF